MCPGGIDAERSKQLSGCTLDGGARSCELRFQVAVKIVDAREMAQSLGHNAGDGTDLYEGFVQLMES